MRIQRAMILCLAAATSLGCQREPGEKAARASAVVRSMDTKQGQRGDAANPAEPETEGHKPRRTLFSSYPRGRWRLLPHTELSRVMLWVSHVLVRHKDAPIPAAAPFSTLPWDALEAPPPRTWDQALKLAQRIAKEARQTPEEFSWLAQKYSEDTLTQGRGGSLGGIVALGWALKWPQALDALATLRPGEVSDVIETDSGFHVLLRRAPPEPEQLSARRIVIGHEGGSALGFLPRSSPPAVKRSRAEARELAVRVATEAKRAPEHFRQLVAKYSDAPEREHGGDLGVRSIREASPIGRELEVLQAARIGEAVGPMDSPFGYEVLLRTPIEPKRKYAAAVVRLSFDPNAPEGHTSSRAAARARAEAMILVLRKQPDRISEYEPEFGSNEVEQWTRERKPEQLARALDEVPIGSVIKAPVEFASEYVVASRLDPEAQPPPPPMLFELRSPSAPPDVPYMATRSSPKWLLSMLDRAQARAKESSALIGRSLDVCADAHEALTAAIGNDGSGRVEAAWSGLRKCLGPRSFDGYVEVVNQVVEAYLLDTGGA